MISHYKQHPILYMAARFGKPDDSLEFKFGDVRKRTLDLFWMYPGPGLNQSWSGIQSFDGNYTKLISLFPVIKYICAAELHGYLVYVPCDTWSIIRIEYGENTWFEPFSNYSYKRDASNYRTNGSWTQRQWRGGEVYRNYQDGALTIDDVIEEEPDE